jgi:hypothetical protein
VAVIGLARLQSWLHPVCLVGAVRILLTLQTNAHVLRIDEVVLVMNVHFVAYSLEIA